MPSIANVNDVRTRWGKDELAEEIIAMVEVRLGDAERMIKRRIKNLDAQITAQTIDVEDVKQVEADAVLRLARNPEGYISESDGNYTYMLAQQLATGKLEILPEEWRMLGWRKRRMVTLVPTFEMPT